MGKDRISVVSFVCLLPKGHGIVSVSHHTLLFDHFYQYRVRHHSFQSKTSIEVCLSISQRELSSLHSLALSPQLQTDSYIPLSIGDIAF